MQPDCEVNAKKEYKLGMICAFFSAILWGFLPLYWKALIPIHSSLIILYRIVMAAVTAFVAAWKYYGFSGIKMPLTQKGLVWKLFASGCLIMANWSIYIFAVNAGHVIQTCIGYYIEPLMVCVFGIVFFKERPTKLKTVSLLFALLGVLIVLVHFKQVPVIALSLAITFATYTAIKKHLRLEALIALVYETIFLAPIALVLILYFEINGKGALAVGQPYQFGLLLLSGILTATPLGLFAMAANRISLISLGIVEYIAPSITLLIGIFLFKEAFDLIQFIAFVVIWIGLVFFTYDEVKYSRKEVKK